jgi:hypothetical protein
VKEREDWMWVIYLDFGVMGNRGRAISIVGKKDLKDSKVTFGHPVALSVPSI